MGLAPFPGYSRYLPSMFRLNTSAHWETYANRISGRTLYGLGRGNRHLRQ